MGFEATALNAKVVNKVFHSISLFSKEEVHIDILFLQLPAFVVLLDLTGSRVEALAWLDSY